MQIRSLLRSLNVPVYSAAIVPVLVAGSLAFHETGEISYDGFILALVGLIIVQIGINVQNDYFDAQTGVDQSKEESFVNLWGNPRPVLFIFTIAFILGTLIFLYFQFTIGGITLILIVCSGAFLGFFYSAPPLRLSYRGMGEAVTFTCFGPLAVMGAFYVQTQEISQVSLLLSIPVGLLTVSILYIHHFPQIENDAKYLKRTSVVQMGQVLATRLFPFLISSPYVLVSLLSALNLLPIGCLWLLFSSPYALYLSLVLWRSLNGSGVLPSKYSVMALHFLSGLLLSAGLIV